MKRVTSKGNQNLIDNRDIKATFEGALWKTEICMFQWSWARLEWVV